MAQDENVDPDSPRLTRRQVLRRGSAALAAPVVFSSLLAACGGDDDGESSAPAEPAAAPAEPPAAPVGDTINFLSWEGYDLPDAMAAWKGSTGVEVKSTYIGNHDEIQSKILAGGAEGTDLITYYQGYKALYNDELHILTPIDEDKVPNLAGLVPFFASDVGNFWRLADGTRIGVPFTWGAGGMNYDASVLPEPPASYFDILEPEFKGRVTFPDDAVGAYSLGAVVLGYDVARLTSAQFDEVTGFLKQIVAQTRGIATSYGDMTTLIVSGEAWVAPLGWAAMNKFAAEAGKDTVKIALPKEGAAGFCDAWAIPTTADNEDTVLAWINESLDPATNAAAANGLAGGATVVGAEEFLDPDIAALYPYEDLESFLAQVKFFENPPVESTEFVTYEQVVSTWQEVKLAA